MNQRKMVGLVLAGVLASTAIGWAAGSQMKSPAQVAAEAAPPEASLITAPVEKRALSSKVTTRGTVRYGDPQAVALAASALDAGGSGSGGGGGGGSSLVTKPPEKGATLGENSVAMEVAGRPVRVLSGAVPMYRDLGPGDTGTDVLQLEQALARLGHRPGKVDGTYDSATEGAVHAWYKASGYQAQGPTDSQSEALRTARQGVSQAEDQLLQAQDALDNAQPPSTTAQARLVKARRGLEEAKRHLSELDAEVGVVVPADEVLFFPNLPLRVDEPKVKRGDDGTKEVMVVTTSRLAIDGSVSIPDAKLVKVGDKVEVVSSELGIEATGVVSKLADKPGTNGVDPQKVYMEVVPDDAPAELTGAAVRLTIAVKSTDGEVLAVPLSALSMGPDGTSRVQVDKGGGATRIVVVEPGLSAEGYVEIKPKENGLTTSDRVVIGKAGRT